MLVFFEALEKGIRKAPMGGPEVDARTVINAIIAGDMALNDTPGRQVYFLMNAMERPKLCHILMNALESAVKQTPGYPAWENQRLQQGHI